MDYQINNNSQPLQPSQPPNTNMPQPAPQEKRPMSILIVGGIIILVVLIIGGAFTWWYVSQQQASVAITPTPTPTPETQTADWAIYTNSQYGFTMSFPDSWKGFTVVSGTWTGAYVSGDSSIKNTTGVILTFKNPQSTTTQLFQDIPVMVFTPAQWELVNTGKIAVSAAPIGPQKIGENSKYVFATPPRWYGFTDAQDPNRDAEKIVGTFKAY